MRTVARTSTGAILTACALSAALLVAGCGGDGDQGTESSGEIVLEPAAAKGPDPFTDSTATSTARPSPITRMPAPSQSGRTGPRSLSGGTPGLYGGTRGTGSCDVQRQIDHLSDQARARVFARAAGIPRASIPGYLRGLTPVVLRADTRVTNHGFRDGRGTGYQSVLQAGTAVLVDDHGVPRVRCACGNPLTPAAHLPGNPGTSGRSWSGYRPDQVVVVAPTVQVITDITIIDIVDNTWIERPVGHQGHDRDHVLPRPKPVTPTPDPHPHDSGSSASPGEKGESPSDEGTSPSGRSTSPETSPTDCVPPTATVTPGATDDPLTETASDTSDTPSTGPTDDPLTETASDTSDTPSTGPTDCPTATVTASPRQPSAPESGTEPETPASPQPSGSSGSPEETGPETVPDSPDLPDGGGLIPDEPRTTDSIFASPIDVFAG